MKGEIHMTNEDYKKIIYELVEQIHNNIVLKRILIFIQSIT